jgi:hypothetical protein
MVVIRTTALVLLGVLGSEGRACVSDTVILRDPIAALNHVNAVFYATVRRSTEVDTWTRLVELEVHEVWKGQAPPRVLNYLGRDCSVRLEDGVTYLLYAELRSDGQLQVVDSAVPPNRATDVVAG